MQLPSLHIYWRVQQSPPSFMKTKRRKWKKTENDRKKKNTKKKRWLVHLESSKRCAASHKVNSIGVSRYAIRYLYVLCSIPLSFSFHFLKRAGRPLTLPDGSILFLSLCNPAVARSAAHPCGKLAYHSIYSFPGSQSLPLVFFFLPSQFVCTNIPTVDQFLHILFLNSNILYIFKL